MDYEDDKYDEKYAALRNPNRRFRPGDGLHAPKLETPPPPVPVDPFTLAPAASEAPPPVPGAPVAPGARLIEPTWRTEGQRAQDPRPPKVYLPENYTPYEIRTDKDGVRSAAIDGGGFAYTHGAPPPAPPQHAPLEALYEQGNHSAKRFDDFWNGRAEPMNREDLMYERIYGTEAALRRQATGRGQNPTLAQVRGDDAAAEAQRQRVYGEGGYREQYLRGRAYDNSLSPAEREAARQELSDLMEIRRINLSDR
ncbi:MAG: hypothetical protein II839_11660, partial [Kiritimatiellae bacterium]|nr:hypothetical protein [Kiritimatiellia bacterium]